MSIEHFQTHFGQFILFVSIITEIIAEEYDQYSNNGKYSILKENAEIIEKLG